LLINPLETRVFGGVQLEVPSNPTDAVIGFVTHFATIGKASFTAKYGR
jgi:hypothetical protein